MGPLNERRLHGVGTNGHQIGFSLLELLVTLGLILVLATLFYGFGSQRNQQRQIKSCRNNLRKIHLALEIFAREHDDRFPSTAGATTAEDALSVLIPQYTAASELFICPGGRDRALTPGTGLTGHRISYAYWMGRKSTDDAAPLLSDRLLDRLPKAVGAPLFSATGKSPGNNHHKYGGNVLFTDGHVDTSGPQALFPLNWPTNVTLLNPR